MKTLRLAAPAAVLLAAAPAFADDWTWVPIRNGATLDAHLARVDQARPNPMTVFALISEINGAMTEAAACEAGSTSPCPAPGS